MASHRYWRLNVIENYGNFYAGKGAVATIDLRVSSGGSNLATTGNGTASASTEVVGFEASKAFDGRLFALGDLADQPGYLHHDIWTGKIPF